METLNDDPAYRQYCREQERLEANRRHNCIERAEDLLGWTVASLERWKPGVVRFTARRKTGSRAEQIIGFAPDNVFENYQLPA